MAMRELGILETVPVTQIWPHEERDFTPWLAENLGRLGKVVGMELEFIDREHRTDGGGRVDILAKDKDGRRIVIENQVYSSDNDHFVRLFGYAASCDAGAVIWVAPDFRSDHLAMLKWLSLAGVEIFAFKVSAYKIGEVYAPHFECVVNPDQTVNQPDTSSFRGPSIYGRFYSPLTPELRREGIAAIGGRQQGWSGRWRRYRAGKILDGVGINYSTTLGLEQNDEKCSAGLLYYGVRRNAEIDKAILDRKSELTASLGGIDVVWSGDGESIVWAEHPTLPDGKEETLDATRQWMKETLVQFHRNLVPKLEEIIGGLELADFTE